MKIKMTMDARQKCSLLSLAVIALLPFALVCCHASSSSSDGVLIDNGSRLVPSPDENPSPTIAEVDASAPVAIVDSASAITSATPRTPKEKCEQTRRNVNAVVAASLACKTDADCTEMYMSCGFSGVCGIAVTKGSESKIKAAEKPWDAASCTLVTTAPCPTCAMPPEPICVSGKCE